MQAKQPDLDTADFESKEAVSNELDVQERKLLDDLKAKENQLEGIGAVPSDEILEQLPAGPTETNENGMLRTAPTQSLKDLEERLGTYYKVYGCESLVSGNEGTYKCYTISAQDDVDVLENQRPRALKCDKQGGLVYGDYIDENKWERISKSILRFVAVNGIGEIAGKFIPGSGWAISLIDSLIPGTPVKSHLGNTTYTINASSNAAAYFAYVQNDRGSYNLLASTNYANIDSVHILSQEYVDPNNGLLATRYGTPTESFYMTGMVRELEFEAVEQYEMYKNASYKPIRHLSVPSAIVSPANPEKGFKEVSVRIQYADTVADLIVLANNAEHGKQ